MTGPNRGGSSSGTAYRVRPSGSSTESHRSLGSTVWAAAWPVLRSSAVMTAVTSLAGSVTGTAPGAIGSTHPARVDQPGGGSSVLNSPAGGAGAGTGSVSAAAAVLPCTTITTSAAAVTTARARPAQPVSYTHL